MFGTFLDKLGGFFDRRFVVAYEIPTLFILVLAVVVLQLLFGPKVTLDWWIHLQVQEQILLTVGILLAIILAAYIFEMLTAPVVRFYEGYWRDRMLTRWAVDRQKKKKTELAGTQATSYYSFPLDNDLLKPTRLGNVLAAAEEYSYQVYRLDAVTWWPRLVSILPDDFRVQIDTSLTPMLTVLNLSLILTLWAGFGGLILLIAQHWIACSAVFFLGLLLARGCYSVAINQAVVYGRQVRVAFDLYRQEIFKQMHIVVPDNLAGERVLWEVLTNWHYYYIPPWDSLDKIPELDYPFYYDTHYASQSSSKIVIDRAAKTNKQLVQIRTSSKTE
jgi:hypothetical protein